MSAFVIEMVLGVIFMVVVEPELYSYFEAAGTEYKIKPKEYIFRQGDEENCIYLIKKGAVKTFYVAENGKEVSFQIAGAGQIVGESAFLNGAVRPVSIRVVKEATVVCCNVNNLFPYMQQNEKLNRTILSLLISNNDMLYKQLKCFTIYDSRKKLAYWLAELTAEENSGFGIVDHLIYCTHESLSVSLNMNRVTITKLMKEFSEKGLIRGGYGTVRVLNRQGLLEIVNEDLAV